MLSLMSQYTMISIIIMLQFKTLHKDDEVTIYKDVKCHSLALSESDTKNSQDQHAVVSYVQRRSLINSF